MLQVIRILLSHTPIVMPLSCDEAYLDLTDVTDDAEALVAQIRAEIESTTQCTASAGRRIPIFAYLSVTLICCQSFLSMLMYTDCYRKLFVWSMRIRPSQCPYCTDVCTT